MIRGLYKTDVCTVTADRSLKEVAEMMRDRNVGDVVVVETRAQAGAERKNLPREARVPIGIVTDRDIVVSCVAQDVKDIGAIPVSDVMTKNIAFVKEDLGLFDTIRKMRESGVGRILVVDENKALLGILTSQNIFDLLNEELHELGMIAHNKRSATHGAAQREAKLPPNLTPDQAQGLRH